jgi:hypothetical protein
MGINPQNGAQLKVNERFGLNSSVEGDTGRTGHGLTHTAETASTVLDQRFTRQYSSLRTLAKLTHAR